MQHTALFLTSNGDIAFNIIVSRCLYHRCFIRISTTSATLTNISFFRTSRLYTKWLISVTERVHERIVITRSATATNMCRIAFIHTSRFYYFLAVIVTKRGDCFVISIITRPTRFIPQPVVDTVFDSSTPERSKKVFLIFLDFFIFLFLNYFVEK